MPNNTPATGLLSVFAFEDDGVQPGMDEFENDLQLVYTADVASVQRATPPEDLNEYCEIVKPCPLQFVETWDLPSFGDILPTEKAKALTAFESEELSEKLHELRSRLNKFGNHLLGYSLHFRTDDPTPGLEWEHLICLDSDPNTHWSWCDGEHLAVYVRNEDLKDHSFRRVYGYAS